MYRNILIGLPFGILLGFIYYQLFMSQIFYLQILSFCLYFISFILVLFGLQNILLYHYKQFPNSFEICMGIVFPLIISIQLLT